MCKIRNLGSNTVEILFVAEAYTYLHAEVFSFCHLSKYSLSV